MKFEPPQRRSPVCRGERLADPARRYGQMLADEIGRHGDPRPVSNGRHGGELRLGGDHAQPIGRDALYTSGSCDAECTMASRIDVDSALDRSGGERARSRTVAGSPRARRYRISPRSGEAVSGRGIRLNVLAPGAIRTPLLEQQLATPRRAAAIRSFPVLIGGFGDAGQLADWVVFILSDAASFLCGTVFVDADFRADDWPRAVRSAGSCPT
ncbi:SDR family oxidoreductase [Nocardia neocaledoniensis]|uniref:SDR family oxidoreductase n=1 Tax=Nocardia neocaledoniensis TaxID=236511 RepID=UPI003CC7E2BE